MGDYTTATERVFLTEVSEVSVDIVFRDALELTVFDGVNRCMFSSFPKTIY